MPSIPRRPFRWAVAIAILSILLGIASIGVPVPNGSSSAAPAARSAASVLTVSPNPDDVGFSATFDASGVCTSPLGGCSYSYSGLPSGCSGSNSASLSCTPSSTGTFSVSATATWGCPVCVSNSSSVSFTVDPVPVVSSMSATPASPDVGQLVEFRVAIAGGSAPFSYTWSNLPSGCSSVNQANDSCYPSTTGSYTVGVAVTDNAGATASDSMTITVNTRLVAALSITPSEHDLGGAFAFSTVATGGATPYTISYANLPPGCASSDVSSIVCTPTAVGYYTVNATVVDANGASASSQASLRVVPTPSVSLSVAPTSMDAGQLVTLTTSVTNGHGPFAYSYSGLPSGCTSSNTSELQCHPSGYGTFAVTVTVTDTDGNQATATQTLTVNPALAVAISANVTYGFTPLPVSFLAVVSGGTAPFTYAWQFAPNAHSTLPTPRYVFINGGNFSVALTVTDVTGVYAVAHLTISVRNSSTYVAYVVAFYVNPPGCGPITLNSVLQADGSTTPLPPATYSAVAPSCPGFSFTQWVPNGGLVVNSTASSSTTVSVLSAGSLTAEFGVVPSHVQNPPGKSLLSSWREWAPYLLLVAGGGIALLLVIRLSSRPRGPGRPPSPSSAPRPTGPDGVPRGSPGPLQLVPGLVVAAGAQVHRLSGRLQDRIGRLARPPSRRAADAVDGVGPHESFVDPVPPSMPSPMSAGPSSETPNRPAEGSSVPSTPPASVASPPPTRLETRRPPGDLPPSSLALPTERGSLPTPRRSAAAASERGRSHWPPSGIWDMTPSPSYPKRVPEKSSDLEER